MCFYVSFTGHRDKFCAEGELERIAKRYPGGVWVHGGAVGFDSQVQYFAENHRIATLIIRPDYQKHKGKQAPIIRNREIAEMGNVLVACYDGRKTGGTFFTITYARQFGKHIELLAVRGQEPQ
jgi:hypothetical protein